MAPEVDRGRARYATRVIAVYLLRLLSAVRRGASRAAAAAISTRRSAHGARRRAVRDAAHRGQSRRQPARFRLGRGGVAAAVSPKPNRCCWLEPEVCWRAPPRRRRPRARIREALAGVVSMREAWEAAAPGAGHGATAGAYGKPNARASESIGYGYRQHLGQSCGAPERSGVVVRPCSRRNRIAPRNRQQGPGRTFRAGPHRN